MTKFKGSTINLGIIIALLVVALLMLFQNPGAKVVTHEMTYTQFLQSEPHIRDVVIRGDELMGHDDQNRTFSVTVPRDPAIATRLAQENISVTIGPAQDQYWLTTLLVNGLPLIGYFFFVTWPLLRMANALEAQTARRSSSSDGSATL